jgi:hypothetical protein
MISIGFSILFRVLISPEMWSKCPWLYIIVSISARLTPNTSELWTMPSLLTPVSNRNLLVLIDLPWA